MRTFIRWSSIVLLLGLGLSFGWLTHPEAVRGRPQLG
jgi:hypothetical protein